MFLAYSMSAVTSETSDRYERLASVSSSLDFDQTDHVSVVHETKILKLKCGEDSSVDFSF